MIYVVGPGRCGSSAVARILHTRLGISMGKSFRPPDEQNVQGYFEDLQFKNLNQSFLGGAISFPDFYGRIHALIERRQGCGLKDPRLSYLLIHYLSLDSNAVVIRCRRPADDVAASMLRCYGWDRGELTRRESCLDLVRYPMLDIDMSERRSDEWIEERLQHFLSGDTIGR